MPHIDVSDAQRADDGTARLIVNTDIPLSNSREVERLALSIEALANPPAPPRPRCYCNQGTCRPPASIRADLHAALKDAQANAADVRSGKLEKFAYRMACAIDNMDMGTDPSTPTPAQLETLQTHGVRVSTGHLPILFTYILSNDLGPVTVYPTSETYYIVHAPGIRPELVQLLDALDSL